MQNNPMTAQTRANTTPMTSEKQRRLYVIDPTHPDAPRPIEPHTQHTTTTRLTMAKPANGDWHYPTIPRDWSRFVAWEYHQWTPVPTGIAGLRLMLLTPGGWDEPEVLEAMRTHQATTRTLWPLATGTGSQQLLRRLGPIQYDPTHREEPLRVLWRKDDVDYILNPATPETSDAPWDVWDLSAASTDTHQAYRLFIAAPPDKSAQWVTRALARQLMLRDTTRWWWDMINQGQTTLTRLADAAYEPTAASDRLVAWLPVPGFHLVFAESTRRAR